MKLLLQMCSLAGLLFAAGDAGAHALAPTLLELRETGAGRVELRWRTPLQSPSGSELAPLLPSHCEVAESLPVSVASGAVEARWILDCGANGLAGAKVGAQGIAGSGADVLLRAELAGGRSIQGVLTADAPELELSGRQGSLAVARSYLRLGLAHILGGADHLLFVLGLVLLVRGRRQLVQTITAFTAGHSVTLSLAALGIVQVSQAAAEAGIALSILVLACELGREDRNATGLLRRRPWAMAALFGLLHGLGFAGALAETGLPAGAIPLALASFNAGIELGQLAFVAALLSAAAALRSLAGPPAPALRLLPAYAIGSCAAFWLFERSAALIRQLATFA